MWTCHCDKKFKVLRLRELKTYYRERKSERERALVFYIFYFVEVADHIASHILQILQLQMNDYKYHYLFTTFVSTLGILKRIVKDLLGPRFDSPARLLHRISKPSTSRTSSTILSISLPSVWSTRTISAYVVSWGTWSAISRRGTRFSINRESFR